MGIAGPVFVILTSHMLSFRQEGSDVNGIDARKDLFGIYIANRPEMFCLPILMLSLTTMRVNLMQFIPYVLFVAIWQATWQAQCADIFIQFAYT